MADLVLQRMVVTEHAGGAKVDLVLSDANPEAAEATESIQISVEVPYEGYPRLHFIHDAHALRCGRQGQTGHLCPCVTYYETSQIQTL
jgi:hypothetical protein